MPKAEACKETNWYLTLPEPGEETQFTPLQKRNVQELLTLRKLEQQGPRDNQKPRDQFQPVFLISFNFR